MLLNFHFRNFRSFHDQGEVSFCVGRKPAQTHYDVDLDGQRLNKVIAVIGPNGAGKTHVLGALASLSRFIVSSFSSPIDSLSFSMLLHSLSHPDKETKLETEFMMAGLKYRYHVVIRDCAVAKESLYVQESRSYRYVFVREGAEETCSYKQKGFGGPEFGISQARKVGGTVSILSAAERYGVKLAQAIVSYFRRYTQNLSATARTRFDHIKKAGKFFHDNKSLFPLMVQIMKDCDLGLDHVEIDVVNSVDDSGAPQILFLPHGCHGSTDQEFRVPFPLESSGTQTAFILLTKLLPVLAQGGVAIIDEIDNDLHPHLLPQILALFRDADTNPHHAQLIFTCHTPEVLNLLCKHQVYLVEKQNHESETWRLDEITGLRADDNLYAKYMAGALGAVPDVIG